MSFLRMHWFDMGLVLAVLVGALDLEVDQLLAVLLALAGDDAAHRDDVAHPGDRGEARAEAAFEVVCEKKVQKSDPAR